MCLFENEIFPMYKNKIKLLLQGGKSVQITDKMVQLFALECNCEGSHRLRCHHKVHFLFAYRDFN
ncbi:MAG: hypothetical protein RIS29_682 [Bacteroidota bacterium]